MRTVLLVHHSFKKLMVAISSSIREFTAFPFRWKRAGFSSDLPETPLN